MKTIVSIFFYLWIACIAYPLKKSQHCPDEFIQLDENCYHFSNNTSGYRNWTYAEKFCTDRKSHLVSIESTDEYSNIRSYFLTNNLTLGEYYWTSGSSEKNVDEFFWTAVNKSLSPNWCSGYPLPTKDVKRCVLFPLYAADKKLDACLVYDLCDGRNKFICELDLKPDSVALNSYKIVNIYVDKWFLNSIM